MNEKLRCLLAAHACFRPAPHKWSVFADNVRAQVKLAGVNSHVDSAAKFHGSVIDRGGEGTGATLISAPNETRSKGVLLPLGKNTHAYAQPSNLKKLIVFNYHL